MGSGAAGHRVPSRPAVRVLGHVNDRRRARYANAVPAPSGGPVRRGPTFSGALSAAAGAEAERGGANTEKPRYNTSPNVELLVKVINGCSVNGAYWIYAAGLTNLEVEVRVEDLVGHAVWSRRSQQGRPFPPFADTGAFETCDSGT